MNADSHDTLDLFETRRFAHDLERLWQSLGGVVLHLDGHILAVDTSELTRIREGRAGRSLLARVPLEQVRAHHADGARECGPLRSERARRSEERVAESRQDEILNRRRRFKDRFGSSRCRGPDRTSQRFHRPDVRLREELRGRRRRSRRVRRFARTRRGGGRPVRRAQTRERYPQREEGLGRRDTRQANARGGKRPRERVPGFGRLLAQRLRNSSRRRSGGGSLGSVGGTRRRRFLAGWLVCCFPCFGGGRCLDSPGTGGAIGSELESPRFPFALRRQCCARFGRAVRAPPRAEPTLLRCCAGCLD